MRDPRVTVLPLSVVFGGQAYRDGVEISRQEFWNRLPSANPLPTTAQATPSDFAAAFDAATEAGEEVVAVPLSSKLSGTHDAALTALAVGRYGNVDVVDSWNVAAGLGLLVAEAFTVARQGAGRKEIVDRITHIRERVRFVFVLDTIEYLHRGGRIGAGQAFVATLLKFKPILSIQEGVVEPLARVRTRAKALEAAQDLLLEQVAARGPQVKLGITHSLAEAEARAVGRSLAQSFGTAEPYYTELGPVVGVHTGPGTVAVAVYGGD